MNFRKKMILTGYKVQYVDRRDLRPRTVHEEVFVMDQKWAEALNLVHIDITDYIRGKYAKTGYAVCTVERIKARRRVFVDLQQLWNEAEPAIPADASKQACSGYHVETASGLTVFKAATETECEQYCDQAVQKGSAPGFLSIVEDEVIQNAD